MRPSILRLSILLAAALAAGCAPGPPATPAPAPIATDAEPGLLEPSSAARRVGQRVELTGMELGRMWTFQDPPRAWWRDTYGFEPTQDWLDHVRLASLRYGDGCSASFVSADGLVVTNHHCARECIEELSSPGADYLEDGFHAATRAEEQVCPGLYLDQLQTVEDVTDRVLAAGAGLAADTARTRAQGEAADSIRSACEEDTGQTCQVVSLYHGGRFHLYRYRRFEPVKLVFAPEHQAASFGGDPDNFTYPRYSLDVTFVRAYQDDTTPVRTDRWFRWSAAGADEGEAVFVVGSPGSTNRLRTVSQVLYMQQWSHPFTVQYLADVVGIYRWIGALGPEAERAVREQRATFENALKAFTGELDGLRDTLLVGRKIRWEAELRRQVERDDALRAGYGDVWDRMSEIQRSKVPEAIRTSLYDIGFLGDPHVGMAGELARFVRESARAPDERHEDYGSERLAEIEAELLEDSPANPDIAARLLAIRLELARRFLPPDDPLVRAAFRPGETSLDAATRVVRGSRVMTPSYRRTLMRGGPAALETETDPAVRLAGIMESEFRDLEARFEELTARETVQEERLARALFAVFGTDIPPDATFTLRITDGVVARYPYNGTFAAPHTTFHGIFERAAAFDHEFPWTLPHSYLAARDRIDLAARLNFVATTDITGGNSGSPMLNREAEIVGVAFDGNMESLPNDFVYDETAARTVGVHSAGIMEALRVIYAAEALVRELLGER